MTTLAQNNMQSIDKLINLEEPGWPVVQQWINEAKNKVEVLPCDTAHAKEALYKTQVSTRSPMGAIIYATGGLLIDHGWIRILGSGAPRLNRSIPDWNKGKSFKEFGERPSFLLIADDAVGGFFAINSGAFGNDAGKIYYLSPDNLEWEPLGLSYTEFLLFCFNGDLATFYKDLRWAEWDKDNATIDGNVTYSFFPYLWTEEGRDINTISRKSVTVEEQFQFMLEMRKKMGL
jgi:hypothetical protein